MAMPRAQHQPVGTSGGMRGPARIRQEIEAHFGAVPPLFAAAESTPEVLDHLWQQTRTGYLDNPLPPVLKDALAAALSRYCPRPYCLIVHACALAAHSLTAADIRRLVAVPPPDDVALATHRARLAAETAPLPTWPPLGSPLDEALRACCLPLFRRIDREGHHTTLLRRRLPPPLFHPLLALLAFLHAMHLWTEGAAELDHAADPRVGTRWDDLCAAEPALAGLVRDGRTVEPTPVGGQAPHGDVAAAAITGVSPAEAALRAEVAELRRLEAAQRASARRAPRPRRSPVSCARSTSG